MVFHHHPALTFCPYRLFRRIPAYPAGVRLPWGSRSRVGAGPSASSGTLDAVIRDILQGVTGARGQA
jgi:hypothetical protein